VAVASSVSACIVRLAACLGCYLKILKILGGVHPLILLYCSFSSMGIVHMFQKQKEQELTQPVIKHNK